MPFQDKLCDTLTDFEDSNLNYIVCRDINVNYFAKDNKKIANYTNNLPMIGCKMKINNHTRFGENCRPSFIGVGKGGQGGPWPSLDFHTLSLTPPKLQK